MNHFNSRGAHAIELGAFAPVFLSWRYVPSDSPIGIFRPGEDPDRFA